MHLVTPPALALALACTGTWQDTWEEGVGFGMSLKIHTASEYFVEKAPKVKAGQLKYGSATADQKSKRCESSKKKNRSMSFVANMKQQQSAGMGGGYGGHSLLEVVIHCKSISSEDKARLQAEVTSGGAGDAALL